MAIGENIRFLRELHGFSQVELGTKIGVTKQNIYNWESGKNSPRKEYIDRLCQLFDISIDELYGQLYRLKGEEPTSVQLFESLEKYKNNQQGNTDAVTSVILDQVPVRVVEVRAQAGYLRGYNDPEYMEHLPVIYVSREFERGGNFQAFVINGDSMVDGTDRSLPHGTTIVGKELQKHYWTSKLHYKQYLFVIVHKDGVLFKQVTNHNVEEGTITIHSFNPLYEDEILNLSDCYQLFYMKKIVDKPIRF